jgi:hypothetical protein
MATQPNNELDLITAATRSVGQPFDAAETG